LKKQSQSIRTIEESVENLQNEIKLLEKTNQKQFDSITQEFIGQLIESVQAIKLQFKKDFPLIMKKHEEEEDKKQ